MLQRMPSPQPGKGFRIRPEHIRRYAGGLEQVEMIDGRKVHVDQTGLVLPGRPYAINEPPPEDQIAIAMDWFERAHRIKTPLRCTYGCKHVIERLARVYISNGATIIAAHRCGIRMLPENLHYWYSPNALLGIGAIWYRRQRQLTWETKPCG